jgi:LysM repeat protein
MKIFTFIKTLTVIIILVIISDTVFSQVPVERSKEKVIISGIPYFIHQVKKGETAYSISKAYGITVEVLTTENPPALYGIKAGQALRIPVRSVTDAVPSDTLQIKKQRDETRYIYHNMKPGETIYFLSKTYGVSENEIIQNNEGININKLPVGAEIAVPRRDFMNVQQKFNDQDKKIYYHKVLEGETLSSIAKKYGLTVRELRKENRDVRFPQVGYYIRVPGVEEEVQEVEPVKADTVEVKAEEPLIIKARPAGYTQVNNLHGSFNVAVLLPFYLEENKGRIEIDSSTVNRGRKIPTSIQRNEDWIYPRTLDFLEMYEGVLLAADTLRSMGLDINLYPFDIKSDTIGVTRLIQSGKLSDMNLIIGPVYSRNLTAVAAYASTLGIPVVSPVPLINNSALSNNPTLFISSTSFEIAQKLLAKKIGEYYDHNFVFVHADTTGTDEDVRKFKKLIFSELSYHLPFEEIKFKEFLFYSRSMFENDSINRLSHTLSERSKNLVIIASEDASVISKTITDIHGLSRKYDVKVFGYPEMREVDNLDPRYYFDLDITMYTPYWINYNKKNVKQFNAGFRHRFLTEPSEKSYAWQGYDIAYYFLSGLAIHGKSFIANPGIHYPDLLQSDYDFTRKNNSDGFENQKLFLIRYTKDYEIKLIEDNNPY